VSIWQTAIAWLHMPKAIVQAAVEWESLRTKLGCVTAWTDEQARDALQQASTAGISHDHLLNVAMRYGPDGAVSLLRGGDPGHSHGRLGRHEHDYRGQAVRR
jgi:hypothetical protein